MPNFVFGFILRTLAAAFWVAGAFRGRRGSSRRPQEKTKKEGFGAVSTPSPDHSQPKHTQPNNTHLPTESNTQPEHAQPVHTQPKHTQLSTEKHPAQSTPSPKHTQSRAHPAQSTPTPGHTQPRAAQPRARPANAHPCFFVLGFEESAFRFLRSFA